MVITQLNTDNTLLATQHSQLYIYIFIYYIHIFHGKRVDIKIIVTLENFVTNIIEVATTLSFSPLVSCPPLSCLLSPKIKLVELKLY